MTERTETEIREEVSGVLREIGFFGDQLEKLSNSYASHVFDKKCVPDDITATLRKSFAVIRECLITDMEKNRGELGTVHLRARDAMGGKSGANLTIPPKEAATKWIDEQFAEGLKQQLMQDLLIMTDTDDTIPARMYVIANTNPFPSRSRDQYGRTPKVAPDFMTTQFNDGFKSLFEGDAVDNGDLDAFLEEHPYVVVCPPEDITRIINTRFNIDQDRPLATEDISADLTHIAGLLEDHQLLDAKAAYQSLMGRGPDVPEQGGVSTATVSQAGATTTAEIS